MLSTAALGVTAKVPALATLPATTELLGVWVIDLTASEPTKPLTL